MNKLSLLLGMMHGRAFGTRRMACALGWLALCLLFAQPLHHFGAEAVQPTAHQIKAAVLGNLAKFVEWPPRTFANSNAPILLGVLGDDPFGPDLETILEPISVSGRRWEVRRARDVAALIQCHVIFISTSEVDRLPEILTAIRGRPILTVSEHPRFLDQGGLINFVLEGKRVRFEINHGAAMAVGLRLNAQLLRLAKSVRGTPQ